MKKKLKKINIAGDLFTDSKNDYSVINELFLKIVKEDQPLILNLEGSLESDDGFILKNKAVPLSLDLTLIDCISKHNVIVSLANNHSLDFGQKGLKKLIRLLEYKSINYFGIRIESDISKVYHYLGNDYQNNPVIVVGLGWSNEQVITKTNKYFSCIEFDYKSAKNIFEHINYHFKSPKIFLYAHYGYEYEFWPLPLHVGLARELIELGYCGVFGTHTHTIQAFEKWENKPIFHGLGNLFFNSRKIKHSNEVTYGRLLSLDLDNQYQNITKLLVKQDLKKNTINLENDFTNYIFINKSINQYSKSYKFLRTRQKNPRPILYHNKYFRNFIAYNSWKYVVQFLGFIKCRAIVKKLLRW